MAVFRMCAVCRKKFEKDELLRITKNKEGIISLDISKKLPGRGMYICKSKDCIFSARKRKVVERALSHSGADIYEKLEKFGEELYG